MSQASRALATDQTSSLAACIGRARQNENIVPNAHSMMRVSCDSLVAMAALTGAAPIFAKNSDRPAGECQPLVQVQAADHAKGAELRCQYVAMEQVEHTLAFIGARPYWLWGVEHGINERGVAVGNHTIFTKDPVAASGLLGMDLVRLALERATSARRAVDVIVELVERHGQGGSGYADTVWPYHNSFLVADGREAFLLEASARHWAVRALTAGGSASNHVTIGADWTRVSADCERHARAQGWWRGEGRIDFAAAYRDTTLAPAIVSSARYAATCRALASADGELDVAAVKRVMRDHNGRESYSLGLQPDDERYYAVCMHADPVGTTTASMIAELCEDPPVRPVWVAFCNPCVAPYLPVFLAGRVPDELVRGGAESDAGGAWWRFKRLLSLAERDWAGSAETIRGCWQPHEREVAAATSELLASGAVIDPACRAQALTRFMDDVWERTVTRLAELEKRLEAKILVA